MVLLSQAGKKNALTLYPIMSRSVFPVRIQFKVGFLPLFPNLDVLSHLINIFMRFKNNPG
jgi:hypothetical protein